VPAEPKDALARLLRSKADELAANDNIRKEVAEIANEAFKYQKLSDLVGAMPINFETLQTKLKERKEAVLKARASETAAENTLAKGKAMGSGRQMRAAAQAGMLKATTAWLRRRETTTAHLLTHSTR
jgi:hypothetical protein